MKHLALTPTGQLERRGSDFLESAADGEMHGSRLLGSYA